MSIQDKLEEIFALCTIGSNNILYFSEVAQIFWPVLDNNLTLCDLSGIFSIANPKGQESLDFGLFKEFMNSISRVKYPTEANHLALLIDDVVQARQINYNIDNNTFKECMDKNVMRVLLKFDLPLRRVFSAFAGRGVKVGGGLTWDEVKRMDIGMDIEGWTAFSGSCSLIPTYLTLQQCTTVACDVLKRFPLQKSVSTLNSVLLYPQFQLLLCFVSVAVETSLSNSAPRTDKAMVSFGRTVPRGSISAENKPINTSLSNLLTNIGIDIIGSVQGVGNSKSSTYRPSTSISIHDNQNSLKGQSTILLPSSSHPEDLYSRAANNARESMIIRLEKLFDEVESRLSLMPDEDNDNQNYFELDSFSHDTEDAPLDRRYRHLSKPVVIGDSIPPPINCPAIVQHSLEAALAHHNLGSYEESLKYLETAKVQLYEGERDKIIQKKKQERKKMMLSANVNTTTGTAGITTATTNTNTSTSTTTIAAEKSENFDTNNTNMKIEVLDSELNVPADVSFYIQACKGNVYQSCGDDEHSLLQYLSAWNQATNSQYHDWEILFINSIGLLAYYNLHFDLALKCFLRVGRYREREYGSRSADTATSWNNQGCCLYCLSRKGPARVLFERSKVVFIECLGSRHPRTVVSSKNCEKAKRSQTIVHDQNIKNNIAMRPDSNRLLIGKEITIHALPPLTNDKGSNGKGKSKK